ncbi:molybdopterin-guanine dinucleotide biosynthesis protein MobA [Methanobrevibacter sp. 87.7]|uniref:nucleotidyltransferase family protein n=1 Tax=Methanobrevibacter sp. 87.7 TaxID=387957 RepID=UPI000B4FD567|nr:NTP transferase domain-containing protein [Methanobrevibacter sp. 87.7]OWT32784.1 molybdopterin-guanine dinucleotide biosynthesis protein MobA [Methanobrevibacter sp. 87.7]
MVGAVITAAGLNSRMRSDLKELNLPIKNKLTLPLVNNKKTILECTIYNVLNAGVNNIILVLGHYIEEIIDSLNDYYLSKVKIVENKPHDVGLSKSLYNGLTNIDEDYVLCVSGDQPTVSDITYKNILNILFNSPNIDNTISFLRRREYGKLDTALGLGMPFALNKNIILPYISSVDDNLNPILRKIFDSGVDFYGVKEEFDLELININHYKDFKFVSENIDLNNYNFRL